jgi:GTPase
MEIFLFKKLNKLLKKRLKSARKIPQENDLGNIEYKLHILHTCNTRLNKLITQIKFRLNQGSGCAIYNLGYTDSGSPIGLSYNELYENLGLFHKLVENANGHITSIKIMKGLEGYCANIYIISKDNNINYQNLLDEFYNLSL